MICRSEILFACRSKGEPFDLQHIWTKRKNVQPSADKEPCRVKTQFSGSPILPGKADVASNNPT
jgi:hypothetical protein